MTTTGISFIGLIVKKTVAVAVVVPSEIVYSNSSANSSSPLWKYSYSPDGRRTIVPCDGKVLDIIMIISPSVSESLFNTFPIAIPPSSRLFPSLFATGGVFPPELVLSWPPNHVPPSVELEKLSPFAIVYPGGPCELILLPSGDADTAG